ncbi:hypothetical protein MOQ_002340 [Trypanosoma cruzi marinkellei]|uniref:Trans-sialidase n=1 Tax=Trypanosoma cruzi marinkellei TaxID=85056 RepID=K2N7E8_TRYCR|nr:hypothetical protein MOQ_002340 [Trypanosoma cruzi marinkellei]
MSMTMHWVALLFLFLLCLSLCVHGNRESLQLPVSVVSRMSGEWGVEVHSPCDPFIVAGILTVDGGTMTMTWLHETFVGPDLAPAADEGETILHAGGLHAFIPNARELTPLLYTICGEGQSNTLNTPHRPGLGDRMEKTEMTEYTGVLFKNPTGNLLECQLAVRDVCIRLLGGHTYGLQSDHLRMKGSLQFIEMQFDVPNMTGHCVEMRGAFGVQQGAIKQEIREKKDRNRRLDSAKGRPDEKERVMDQNARNGAIVIRLVRRQTKVKSK